MSQDSSLVFKVGEPVTKPAGVATESGMRVLVCRYYITITRLMQHQCVCVFVCECVCVKEGSVCVCAAQLDSDK